MTDSRARAARCSDPAILRPALVASLRKLDPRVQLRNPVMFVVEVGAAITTGGWLMQAFGAQPLGGGDESAGSPSPSRVWLWLTVIFGNLAEAIAEGRGKAQAATLRAMRTRDDGDAARRHADRRLGAAQAATSWSSRPAR